MFETHGAALKAESFHEQQGIIQEYMRGPAGRLILRANPGKSRVAAIKSLQTPRQVSSVGSLDLNALKFCHLEQAALRPIIMES